MEKIAVVVTVLNEQASLPVLFSALEKQTRKPDEVVIVDGGSTDDTLHVLKSWSPKFSFRWFVKKGNRSVGRNAGIQAVKAAIIAITDAGCIPDVRWLENIAAPLLHKTHDVAAGYYSSLARAPFEKAAAAYMLVMPDRIDEHHFLPATRSMALTKNAWKKVGGFPEAYTHNEDYVFARKLESSELRLTFVRNAIVQWSPPATWRAFLKQIWRFAYGDCEAGIVRPKVVSIFLRWLVFIAVGYMNVTFFLLLFTLYAIPWSIAKNFRHVQLFHAFWILPLMQISTDIVVMVGSIQGLFFYAKTHH